MAAEKDYLVPISVARMQLKLTGLETIPEDLLVTKHAGRVTEQFIPNSDLQALIRQREDEAVRRGLAALGRAAEKPARRAGGVRFIEED